MSSPNLHARNGGTGDLLVAALLGLFLMMVLTTWWWHAMR